MNSGSFLDSERPVDAGGFHEKIVGSGAFVGLDGTGAYAAVVSDDGNGSAADAAAQRQLEMAGAGRHFIGCLPGDSKPPGIRVDVTDRHRAMPRPRADLSRDADERWGLRGWSRTPTDQRCQKYFKDVLS